MASEAILSRVEFRAATAADVPRLAVILNDPPPTETLAIVGSVARAHLAGRMMIDAGLTVELGRTVVAIEGGEVVGLLEAAAAEEGHEPGISTVLKLAPVVLARLGPQAFVRTLRWMRINPRVQFEPVPGAYHVFELDVAASHRGRGIGGALLDRAEIAARACGHRCITLTTKVTNPARRLYERHGFRVIGTKLDAEWARWASSPGRVQMMKDLERDAGRREPSHGWRAVP